MQTILLQATNIRFACLVVVTAAGLMAAGDCRAGSSNSLMDISADGKLLACSNRDSGTVSIIDLERHKKVRETVVGKKPEGVSFLGKTHSLAAAVYAEDKVVFVDADAGGVIGETAVFDEPYGVVSNAAGTRLYVTLDYPGRVVEIDVRSRAVTREISTGPFSRGIAITADESRLYVTEFYTAAVVVIDLKTGRQLERLTGISTDNLARQIVLHPSRPKAYMPHIRSRIKAASGSGSIFPYVAVVDTVAAGQTSRRKRVPMDAFSGARITANPWENAVSPDGKRLYVVFAGTNDMFACNIVDDDYREFKLSSYLQVGLNPRAVRVAPDNKTLYVYNALDFNVVAYDAARMRKTATIEVCENPLSQEVHTGKVLFYSAVQPMTLRRWISCSSCHPDGESDGRTWQNPEGLRDTTALFGMAWTHPLHWSADRDEVQDFEHTIRGPLMQGRGLIRGKVNPQLGEPNGGLSQALDALAAYSNTHKFTLSPHAKNGPSASAQRGRTLFFSKKTGCAVCHKGPLYTDSTLGENALLHDVGTGNADPSEKMGPKYDTPTLLGIYRTAPYLHHGKAPTLEAVLTTLNKNDKHGKTSHLSKSEIIDLVEFLKALPYEDPEPAAKAAGLRKVER